MSRVRGINQLKAGTVLSFLSLSLGYLIAIIYTPIMLRLIGQSEFGLYNLVSSVVAYLGVLNFGFGNAYMRFFMRYRAVGDEPAIARLNGMFFVIFTVAAALASIAGLLLVGNASAVFGSRLTAMELERAKILMILMTFNMALSFPASIFNSYIIAHESYIFQKALQLIKNVIHPFVMLPVLLLGYGSIGMVIATTVLTLLLDTANIAFCFRNLKIHFAFHNFDTALLRHMTVFSFFIFTNMLIDQINWNVDKFIIGRFRGTVSVAVYGLAAQLNSYYMSFSTMISSMFIPRVNRMIATGYNTRDLNLLLTKVGRIQFMVLSLIGSGLIFFGRPFIRIWAGENYGESYAIALMLIIPVTVPLIQNLGIEIQCAMNMHRLRSIVYFVIALANVAVSIPLTKAFGGLGAATGTALTFIIGNGLVMNIYYHRALGLDMVNFWKQILRFMPSLLVPALFGTGIMLIVDISRLSSLILLGMAYAAIFCASMWTLGMNAYERNLIRNPVVRIAGKVMPRLLIIAGRKGDLSDPN